MADEAYRAFLVAQRQLTQLIADGEGNTPEADRLRDLLEGEWSQLDELEAEGVTHQDVLLIDEYFPGNGEMGDLPLGALPTDPKPE